MLGTKKSATEHFSHHISIKSSTARYWSSAQIESLSRGESRVDDVVDGFKPEILQFKWGISPMIAWQGYMDEVRSGLERGPVAALIGPRQL